jgi:hypothetical protein
MSDQNIGFSLYLEILNLLIYLHRVSLSLQKNYFYKSSIQDGQAAIESYMNSPQTESFQLLSTILSLLAGKRLEFVH